MHINEIIVEMKRSFDMLCELGIGNEAYSFWPYMVLDDNAHKFLVDLVHEKEFLYRLAEYV